MKRTASIVALVGIAAVAVTGCDTARQQESRTIEENQKTLLQMYPVPRFDTSLERDIMVQLYGLRNKARSTWSVITSDGTGTPMFDCPSIGFPIANDVRLTARSSGGEEQAEPNGVYPAASSWGTWVFCVEDDGSLTPIYNEMDTLTFPFPVSVDYATGKITRAGSPSMTVTLSDAVSK